ncbi:MAG: DNA cytosine methyltransferase [Clostridiaceae bacterium]
MPIQVVDLFCGVGGLTRGMLDAGLEVRAGFDIDETCRFAYEENNQIQFHNANIRDMRGEEIEACYDVDATRILVGCAPCQPFSQMRFKMKATNEVDEKYNLLTEFGRMIQAVNPTVISMENVPQIQKTTIFDDFIQLLIELGYHVSCQIVYCPDYGISQSRRRFVLLASLLGEINLIPATHDRNNVQVQDFIQDLPHIAAGQVDENDPMHRSAHLAPINIQRIQASIPGGTWRDWPEELRCPCHRKESGQTYSSVYGRMRWNQIGPTITTQFYCYGTGRYGHPEQDRALTLREGALLQTFPRDYNFMDPNKKFSLKDVARHIGNAVPVRLGEVIGLSIIEHLEGV